MIVVLSSYLINVICQATFFQTIQSDFAIDYRTVNCSTVSDSCSSYSVYGSCLWLLYLDDPTTLKLARVRRLTGNTCPDYSVLLHDGSALAVASERPFNFEFDSVNPVTLSNNKPTATTAGIISLRLIIVLKIF